MNTKEKLLKTLKDFGRMSTSRAGAIVGVDYNISLKYLNILLKENKVIKQEETMATYWKIEEKEVKNNGKRPSKSDL